MPHITPYQDIEDEVSGIGRVATPFRLRATSIAFYEGDALRRLRVTPPLTELLVSPTNDLALVTFAEPVFPRRQAELTLQDGETAIGSSAAVHTLLEHRAELCCLASRMEYNGSNCFQGPGRTGHSGCGFFNAWGQLVGVMSEAFGPAQLSPVPLQVPVGTAALPTDPSASSK